MRNYQSILWDDLGTKQIMLISHTLKHNVYIISGLLYLDGHPFHANTSSWNFLIPLLKETYAAAGQPAHLLYACLSSLQMVLAIRRSPLIRPAIVASIGASELGVDGQRKLRALRR